MSFPRSKLPRALHNPLQSSSIVCMALSCGQARDLPTAHSGSQPISIPECAYPSPLHSPDTAETPEVSRLLSTSHASSASPPVASGEVDLTVKIATPSGSVPMSVDPARMHTKHASLASTASSSSTPHAGSQAPAPHDKRSTELFAVAQPVAW